MMKLINYNKNKLINKTLDEYYATFSHMLDTSDYVPEKYNAKIGKYIFKNMKKSFKLIDKEDKKYQREWKKKQKAKMPKRVSFWKRLFKRKSTNTNADSNLTS